MSIYASIEGIGDLGDPEHLGAPWAYQGSHIPPREDGPRGGTVGLAVIPSHITADGRDDQPADGPPWPFLRLHLDAPGNDPCVILDPAQARHLAEQLTTWADRVSEPAPTPDPQPTHRQGEPMALTDAELRNTLRPHTGQYGSPIQRLHATGEITEHTHRALTGRAIELELDNRDIAADRLRDAAEYVLDAGCRPPVDGWTER